MQTDIKISCQLKYLDDSVLVEHQTAITHSFGSLYYKMTDNHAATNMHIPIYNAYQQSSCMVVFSHFVKFISKTST